MVVLHYHHVPFHVERMDAVRPTEIDEDYSSLLRNARFRTDSNRLTVPLGRETPSARS